MRKLRGLWRRFVAWVEYDEAAAAEDARVFLLAGLQVDLYACPQCYGHAVQSVFVAELSMMSCRCVECGLVVGRVGHRNTTDAARVWNTIASVRDEQVVLAQAVKSCPRLFKAVIS